MNSEVTEMTMFRLESGEAVEGRVVARYERPDLGWRRQVEVLIGEMDGKSVASLRHPVIDGSSIFWGPDGFAQALRALEELILRAQPPAIFAGSLVEYLNLHRNGGLTIRHGTGNIRFYGRPRPVRSEETQRTYGVASNRLAVPLDREQALGYRCSRVPTECATDGVAWAVLRDGKWCEVTWEELKNELQLEGDPPRA